MYDAYYGFSYNSKIQSYHGIINSTAILHMIQTKKIIALIIGDITIRELQQTSPLLQTMIHARPLLDWVVRAMHNASMVDHIITAGSEEIDFLLCSRYIRKRISSVSIPFPTLLSQAVRALDDENISEHFHDYRFIITFGNAVYLTASTIDSFIHSAEDSPAELVIPAIPQDMFTSEEKFTLKTISDEKAKMVPGVIAYCKSIQYVSQAIWLLQQHLESKISLNAALTSSSKIKGTLAQNIDHTYSTCRNPDLGRIIGSVEDICAARDTLPLPRSNYYKKVMVITNPKSGQGFQFNWFLRKVIGLKRPFKQIQDNTTIVNHISHSLDMFGISHTVAFPQSADQARETARQCTIEGYDLVIAAGGDGTLNTIVNGMVNSKTKLGIIPLGTANVFAIQADIPTQIHASCQLIAEGTPRAIDVGKINEHYFIGLAGIGFDAYVMKHTHKKLKKIVGGLSYLLSTLYNYLTYPFNSIRFSLNNSSTVHRAYLIMICNGKFYGGDHLLAPRAELDDGYLDIIAFSSKRLKSIFFYLRGFFKGNILKYADIIYKQSNHITIKEKQYVHLDGEYLGKVPITMEVVHKGITIII